MNCLKGAVNNSSVLGSLSGAVLGDAYTTADLGHIWVYTGSTGSINGFTDVGQFTGYVGSRGDTGFVGSRGYTGSGVFNQNLNSSNAVNFADITITGNDLSQSTGLLINNQYGAWGMDSAQNSDAKYFRLESNSLTIYDSSNSTKLLDLDNNGNLVATLNVTAYSDIRLKDNIRTIANGLDKTLRLRGVSYDRNGVAGVGVIAQEVKEILPEVVVVGQDGLLSVAYGNIVGVLIEAIKDLKKEVDDLKKNLS